MHVTSVAGSEALRRPIHDGIATYERQSRFRLRPGGATKSEVETDATRGGATDYSHPTTLPLRGHTRNGQTRSRAECKATNNTPP